MSQPFVERLIGTISENVSIMCCSGMGDQERKLAEFQTYYNAARGHASLAGRTPLTFTSDHTLAPADLNNVRWVSHCRDLVQLPVAAWPRIRDGQG
jgi:hypothetical protein